MGEKAGQTLLKVFREKKIYIYIAVKIYAKTET